MAPDQKANGHNLVKRFLHNNGMLMLSTLIRIASMMQFS